MSEWISVSTEKPPKDRPFLSCVWDETYDELDIYLSNVDQDDEKHFEGYTCESRIFFSRRLGIGPYYRYQIKYWMEIPKTPDEFEVEKI